MFSSSHSTPWMVTETGNKIDSLAVGKGVGCLVGCFSGLAVVGKGVSWLAKVGAALLVVCCFVGCLVGHLVGRFVGSSVATKPPSESNVGGISVSTGISTGGMVGRFVLCLDGALVGIIVVGGSLGVSDVLSSLSVLLLLRDAIDAPTTAIAEPKTNTNTTKDIFWSFFHHETESTDGGSPPI